VDGVGFDYLAGTEMDDPNSGTFAQVAAMGSGRGNPTATLLRDGKIVIVGSRTIGELHSSAEFYDYGNRFVEKISEVESPYIPAYHIPMGSG
jgi:hypothetical protein